MKRNDVSAGDPLLVGAVAAISHGLAPTMQRIRKSMANRVFCVGSCRMVGGLCLIVSIGGCTDGAEDTRGSITVLVAASLSEVVTEVAHDFEAHSATRVLISAGASGALAKQIAFGAPCDVFISADPVHTDSLAKNDVLIPASVRSIGINELVVATRKDRPAATKVPADYVEFLTATHVRRIAIANPAYAPAGRYAQQALMSLDLWSVLSDKLVLADDVRSAVNLLAMETVDAAIVYQSDAATSDSLATAWVFSPDDHDRIVYSGGVTRASTVQGSASAFLRFVASDAAAPIWRRHGFRPVDEDAQLAMAPAWTPVEPTTIASAVALSIRVSCVALMILIVPGVLLASWLARTRSRLRPLVEVVAMTPLVLPPVVTGFMLLWIMRTVAPDLLFTWWAAAIASAIVGLPLLVRSARAAIEAVDPRHAMAAATLGASPWRILRTITLPLAWKGIVGGGFLAWARAVGEFGATIVVAGNFPAQTQTIPTAIWSAIQSPNAKSAAPLVAAAVALSALAVLASEWLVRSSNSEYRRA